MIADRWGLLDYLIISGYAVLVIILTLLSQRKRRSKSIAAAAANGGETTTSMFLADRSANWFAVGCTFFVSDIGLTSMVGLCGNAARYGLVVSVFDWGSPFMFLLLGWLFNPLYVAARVMSVPEWAERRYDSKWIRLYLSSLSLVLYISTKAALAIIAGSTLLESFFGLKFWVSAGCLVVSTGIYVIIGGMHAIIYTEIMQTFVLVGGSLFVLSAAVEAAGGWHTLFASTQPEFLRLGQEGGPYPWQGLLFGYPWLALWYHCTDQEMVQRGLTARSHFDNKLGCVFAGFLKFLPPLLFAVPGLAARLLYHTELGIVDYHNPSLPSPSSSSSPPPTPLPSEDTDQAYPLLVTRLLPSGVLGIVVAAMLAAIMSTLASTFNSSATLFTNDIYLKMINPNASSRRQVIVGQCAAGCIVVLSLVAAPIIQGMGKTMYEAVQSCTAALAPPLAVLFLCGALSDRVNKWGAAVALGAGLVMGLVQLSFIVANGSAPVNPMEFAAILAGVCLLLIFVVSLLTERPALSSVAGLTWPRRKEAVLMSETIELERKGLVSSGKEEGENEEKLYDSCPAASTMEEERNEDDHHHHHHDRQSQQSNHAEMQPLQKKITTAGGVLLGISTVVLLIYFI